MILTKNQLKTYCQKLINAQLNYLKVMQEDKDLYEKDFKYAGQQYANVRRNERKGVLEAEKQKPFKKADELIETLKTLNEDHIKSLYKAGQTPQYEKTLSKFMTLSGGKINDKIISFMSDNYDIEGLEFLYDDSKSTKSNALIKTKLDELKRGYEPCNTIIELLEYSKNNNMYSSGIKTLVSKLNEICEGLPNIKAFSNEEARNYILGVKTNKIETNEESDLRLQLWRIENGYEEGAKNEDN